MFPIRIVRRRDWANLKHPDYGLEAQRKELTKKVAERSEIIYKLRGELTRLEQEVERLRVDDVALGALHALRVNVEFTPQLVHYARISVSPRQLNLDSDTCRIILGEFPFRDWQYYEAAGVLGRNFDYRRLSDWLAEIRRLEAHLKEHIENANTARKYDRIIRINKGADATQKAD